MMGVRSWCTLLEVYPSYNNMFIRGHGRMIFGLSGKIHSSVAASPYKEHTFHKCVLMRKKHTKPAIPPTRIMRLYKIHGSITDKESAEEFVFALNSKERKHLYEELARYHDAENNTSQTSKPTRQQLNQVALHQMLPFIGFGFLDNLIMIVAGEYIDVTLGAALGISTMAAAALGNLISDVGGIGSASYVESLASKIGVRNPHLSPQQVDMSCTKWASNWGRVLGVSLGCLLGMFPLLFLSDRKENESDDDNVEDSSKAGSSV